MGFYIDGRKAYRITGMIGGKGKNGGEYTFLDLETKAADSKYSERLKVKVWGKDITNEFAVGERVAILNAYCVDLQKWKSKHDPDKTYYDISVFCDADDILKKAEAENEQGTEQSAEPSEPAKKSARDVDISALQDDDDDDEPLPF